jgi:hypothetical protein
MTNWTRKKREEKLDCIHYNPVRRGLIPGPGDLEIVRLEILFSIMASPLAIDRMLKPGPHRYLRKPSVRTRHVPGHCE